MPPFYVTGRDVEEQELALEFSSAVVTWSLLGDASRWALPDTRRRVLESLSHQSPQSPTALAEGLDITPANARQTLKRMADDDQIKANGDGTYSLIGDTSDGSDSEQGPTVEWGPFALCATCGDRHTYAYVEGVPIGPKCKPDDEKEEQ